MKTKTSSNDIQHIFQELRYDQDLFFISDYDDINIKIFINIHVKILVLSNQNQYPSLLLPIIF